MPAQPPEDDAPQTLRAALRQLAGGVSIITAGSGDSRAGFTATSMTSLTLDPPCILVCVNRKVSAWPTILRERRFCANILADRHTPLATRFSGSGGIGGADRFGFGAWVAGDHGTPVLADALAAIECDLDDAIERHSHLIVIGAVRHVRVIGPGEPLVYLRGGYGRAAPI